MALTTIDKGTVEYYYTALLRKYLEDRNAWADGQFDTLIWKDMKRVFEGFKEYMKAQSPAITAMCHTNPARAESENADAADMVVCEYILKALHYQHGYFTQAEDIKVHGHDKDGRELKACMRSIMGAMYMKKVYDKKCVRTEGLQYAMDAWHTFRPTFDSGRSVSKCNIINWDNMSMGTTNVGHKVRDWIGDTADILDTIWKGVQDAGCLSQKALNDTGTGQQDRTSSPDVTVKSAVQEVVQEQQDSVHKVTEKLKDEHARNKQGRAPAPQGTHSHRTPADKAQPPATTPPAPEHPVATATPETTPPTAPPVETQPA
ncbi:hypothetical protein AK88_05545, partial [Plasmodium fragile]